MVRVVWDGNGKFSIGDGDLCFGVGQVAPLSFRQNKFYLFVPDLWREKNK